MTGNERRKYIIKRLVELGVDAPKQPVHPFKVRIGMKEAAKARAAKKKQDCRSSGQVMLNLKSKRT